MFEDAVRRYGLALLLLALFFQLLFCDGGIVPYLRLKSDIRSVETSAKTLERENILLNSEIDKLQKDDQYLEDVVRKKYGFVREGEKVYRIEK
jgi:cell division protein FtsB